MEPLTRKHSYLCPYTTLKCSKPERKYERIKIDFLIQAIKRPDFEAVSRIFPMLSTSRPPSIRPMFPLWKVYLPMIYGRHPQEMWVLQETKTVPRNRGRNHDNFYRRRKAITKSSGYQQCLLARVVKNSISANERQSTYLRSYARDWRLPWPWTHLHKRNWMKSIM